jgi:hypothetical protein
LSFFPRNCGSHRPKKGKQPRRANNGARYRLTAWAWTELTTRGPPSLLLCYSLLPHANSSCLPIAIAPPLPVASVTFVRIELVISD